MRAACLTFLVVTIGVVLMMSCKDDDENLRLVQLSTIGVSEISSTGAKSGGNVISDGGAPVLARGVVWSEEESPTLEAHLGLTIDGEGPGVFQSTISGLNKGQLYYLRAYGTNAAGTAYGQQIEFSTYTDLPGVRIVDISNISPTGAFIEGEVFDEGNAPVITYGMVWSNFEIPNLVNNTDFTSEGSGMGSFTSSLTGLISDKTYYIRAYAVNATGTGYGQVNQFTTLPCSLIVADVVEVINPVTGRIWMDRNLGASRAATSLGDEAAYGDLYQWGRNNDGHQCRSAHDTSKTVANSSSPNHSDFILSNDANQTDWLSPHDDNLWQGVNGINNPCPEGFRLPTDAEWEEEHQSWNSNNTAGAFESTLKLPPAGQRHHYDGFVFNAGYNGRYWSSTVSNSNAHLLYFDFSAVYMSSNYRASGVSVRCIRD